MIDVAHHIDDFAGHFFEAAVSLPCSCSCAIASGDTANAAMNVAATATFKTVVLIYIYR